MNREKKRICLASIGHNGCGKSTLFGHLVYQLGGVAERTIVRIEKEDEWEGGRRKFSFLMATSFSERRTGITNDVSFKFKVETERVDVTLIDTPGHRDFMKNTITGVSQADAAILVVDSTKGRFEIGISRSGQTREHLLLAFVFGVKQLIIVVNKMDDVSVRYNESRFDQIRKEIEKLLKSIGYRPKRIPIIPISGWEGDNLTETTAKFSWWKKGKTKWGGMTLLEAINSIKVPRRRIDKPLRIPILRVDKISGIGTVAIGRIATGIMKPGMEVFFAPGIPNYYSSSGGAEVSTAVRSIEIHYQPVRQASAGDIVGFNVRGIPKAWIGRGYVCGDKSNNPPKIADMIVARIVIMDHPTQIKIGYEPVLDCCTRHVRCRFERILEKFDRITGKSLGKNPEFLEKKEAGLVMLEPLQPIVCENFKDYPLLGRISLRDNKRIVAVGVIKKVLKNWRDTKWSMKEHWTFPKRVRDIVILVLLCSNRSDCVVSRIPKDVLIYVLLTFFNPNWFQ